MLIYTCPKCVHDLMVSVLTCIPPIHKYKCIKCGWSHEEREEVNRVPFPEPQPAVLKETTYTYNASNFSNAACKSCSNNPANGGSGICFCTLGSQITC